MIYDVFIAPFTELEFMRRALVGAFALALGGGPVGVFLMLRRMSLSGDAMAHAILPGAAVGYLISGLSLGAMTVGGMTAGVAVALLSGTVSRFTTLREDASMAAFYLISLALGVTIVSIRGSNIDLLHVLFGSVLALDDATLLLLASVASVTLIVMALILRPLILDSVDPGFLRSVSRAGAPVHMLFVALVVLNLVAGFHALGTLLAVGLMMLPAISARFWTEDITMTIALAIGLGMLSSLVGLLASYHFSVPSGPAIILAAGAIYMVSLLAGRRDGLLLRLLPRQHLVA